jgi:uncharacterized protein (TIGR02300 family)
VTYALPLEADRPRPIGLSRLACFVGLFLGISGSFCVVKANWGIKRTCQSCSARFYDLNKSPIKCPKCGREHDREDFVKVRRGRGSAAATAAATAAAAAAAAKASKKKVDEGALGGDDLPDVEGDEALEDADDLADEADDIESEVEVEVEDDKGEGDR